MGRALGLVAQLPRREQEVFALCAWSKLSYEDAAIALRIPIGTVRSRLSRCTCPASGTRSRHRT
jgi:DNA-directed RNA polymerase specialized sigma24 family protein